MDDTNTATVTIGYKRGEDCQQSRLKVASSASPRFVKSQRSQESRQASSAARVVGRREHILLLSNRATERMSACLDIVICEEMPFTRLDRLRYIVEHQENIEAREYMEWMQMERDAIAVGVGRQITPDAKVAKAIWRPRKEKFDAAFGSVCSRETKRASNGRECQVCRLPSALWRNADALLLNSCGQPIKVPGTFCSKDCFEHI